MLQTVAMIAVRVARWPEALAWYTDVLGLTAEVVQDDHQFAMLGFAGGGPHLALVGGYEVDTGAPSRCMPNIQVEDLDGTVAALRDKGVVFDDNLHGADEGYRLITLYDPEHNAIQLFEWAAR